MAIWSRLNFFIWNLVFTLQLRVLLRPWTVSFEKDRITSKAVSQLKCPKIAKSWDLHCKVLKARTKESGLAFFSTGLRHMFKSIGVIEIGKMLREKGLHKPEFAFNILRILSVMINTELIEYNIVGYTMTPLLGCFFNSRLNAGDKKTTRHYMKFRTFNNLQFRQMPKKSFQSNHFDLREASGEKSLLYFLVLLRFLMFRKTSNNHFTPKTRCKMVASR